MRRRDRELTDPDDLASILQACTVCHLAMHTEGRVYVVPLNYGFVLSGPLPVLYFHSASEGRKLELLARSPGVAFAIDRTLGLVVGEGACDWGMRYESILGEGIVCVVTDDGERRRGLEAIMEHYRGGGRPFDPQVLAATTVLRLVVSNMTGKRKA